MNDGEAVKAGSSDTLRLSDLNAAALLLAHGFTLVRAEPTSDPRRFEFVLHGNRAKGQQLLDAFWSGSATVKLERFVTAQKKLKNIIHRGAASGRAFGNR